MIGLALGAFEWSATTAFVSLRSAAIGFVVDHGPAWLLADNAPWWLLTNYPEAHDVFTWLDGALIVGWIVGTAILVGGWVSLWLVVAARAMGGSLRANAYALAYTLIPLAGAGLFVGLSSLPADTRARRGAASVVAARSRARRSWAQARAGACILPSGSSKAGSPRRTRAGALVAMAAAAGGVLAAWAPFVFH